MTIISKKVDKKIENFMMNTTMIVGTKKIKNLPTITYTEAENIVKKQMKFVEGLWKYTRIILLIVMLGWYLPVKKDLGFLPSIFSIMLLIYLKLLFGKHEIKNYIKQKSE